MSKFPSFREVDSIQHVGFISDYVESPERFARLFVRAPMTNSNSGLPHDGFMFADVVVFASSDSGHSAEMLVPKTTPGCGDLREDEDKCEWSPSDKPSPVEKLQVSRMDAISDMKVRLIDTGNGWQTMMWTPRNKNQSFADFVNSSMSSLAKV